MTAHAAGDRQVPDWIEGPCPFSPDPLGRRRADRLHLVRPDGFVAASFPLYAGSTARFDVDSALAALDLRGVA